MEIKTSEAVFKGHPDKICDQVADGILDAILTQDKESRIAIECLIKNNMFYIVGEVTTKAVIDYPSVAKKVLDNIGLNGSEYKIVTEISEQSHDISQGIDKLGAGDQGIIYGYATDETPEYLPLPYSLARQIAISMDETNRKNPNVFGLDGKCQVSVVYDENENPVHVSTIVVSAQTKPGVERSTYEPFIYEVIEKAIPWNLRDVETLILINTTGEFVIGGSYADSGLTGRKLQVDSYGSLAHHGGGAYSGKDYTKVDRSGAYYTRYVAKAIVKAGLASECEVSVAYAIGVPFPVALDLHAKGSKYSDSKLIKAVNKLFDFSPVNIIRQLKLKEIKYQSLARYGHFGWSGLPWENIEEHILLELRTILKVDDKNGQS